MLGRELLQHAVVRLAPVCRQVGIPGIEFPALAGLIGGEEPLELGLRGGDRNDVEAAAVVRAVLGGGLGRVDLQQDEHGFYLSSADMRGDQKKIRVSMSTGKTLSLIDIL